MIQGHVIDEVILQERAEHLRIAAVRVDFDEVAEVFNLGAQFKDVRYQRGLPAGEHNSVQKRAAFLEESYLIHHPSVLGESEVGVVAIGTTQVAAVVPENAGGLLWIIQEGKRRNIRRVDDMRHGTG